jgi:hypothetical protein
MGAYSSTYDPDMNPAMRAEFEQYHRNQIVARRQLRIATGSLVGDVVSVGLCARDMVTKGEVKNPMKRLGKDLKYSFDRSVRDERDAFACPPTEKEWSETWDMDRHEFIRRKMGA